MSACVGARGGWGGCFSCNNDYLSCVDGISAQIGWDARFTFLSTDVLTRILNDSLSVSFRLKGAPADVGVTGGVTDGGERRADGAEGSGKYVSGAARSSRGVERGRWYWEVEVGGPCGLTGIGEENFDTASYPGFDERSFGYGDAGYGGELFNDAGASQARCFATSLLSLLSLSLSHPSPSPSCPLTHTIHSLPLRPSRLRALDSARGNRPAS